MASAISLPARGDAFSAYAPSSAAYFDILSSFTSSSSTSSSSPRVIKLTPRTRPAPPSASQQLDTLLSSIAPLIGGRPVPHSYQHLSCICETLVLPPHNLGPAIYARVKEELGKAVALLGREWKASIMARSPGWLDTLIAGWRSFEARVQLLGAVFVYLDRVYSGESNLTIFETAVQLFREGIWGDEIIFGKTRDDLLAWATAERDAAGPSTERRPTILALTNLAARLSASESLTEPYLEMAAGYYAAAAGESMDAVEAGNMSPSKYVHWVLQKVEEEMERVHDRMEPRVERAVGQIVRDEAGSKMGDRIVRRALDEAMDTTDLALLSQLYRFVTDAALFSTFVAAMQAHVQSRLTKVISDPANDAHMIEGTLSLKRFADQAVSSLFAHLSTAIVAEKEEPMEADSYGLIKPDQKKMNLLERARRLELEDAVRTGFKAGMGSRQNAPAEWIAKHLDVTMRKGQGSGTEEEFNALLDEIVALIGYTPDKDVFKAFYANQLAKRLLLSKSASDDMERNMIIKLQNEMGEEFTTGDVMMKDLALSETLAKNYQSALAKAPEAAEYRDAGNFTANVLTEAAWPQYPLLKDGWAFKLTPELQSSVDAFNKWYATQHSNRQLSWRWQLATVVMTARFPSGKYEVTVSLFQAVVLRQFDDEDSLTFADLQQRTGIEASELVRTVQSLALGRKGTRVLLKKPPGKEVLTSDTFTWNKGFTSERIRFKINQIQQDMSAEESKATNEQILIDRVSILEATIVRIMKSKKKLTLQLLIDEVVRDVSKRFPPDVKEIKKRMESLIEREFLERSEDDRNMLNYVA